MLRPLFLGCFSGAVPKVAATMAAISAIVRKAQSHVAKCWVTISEVFGADAYHSSHSVIEKDSCAPVADTKAFTWDDDLVFSGPRGPSVQRFPKSITTINCETGSTRTAAELSHGAVPSFVDIGGVVDGPHERLLHNITAAWRVVKVITRARAPTLLMSAVLVLLWIGAGQSNPLPQRRNPDADAVAERFSRPDTPTRPPVTRNAVTTFDTPEDAAVSNIRFDFAPRLGDFYDNDQNTAGSAIDSDSPSVDYTGITPPGFTAAIADHERIALSAPLSDDAALILLHNLPAGTQLSAGRRISATDWALTRSDLGNIAVTLPANRRDAVIATVEVFSVAGTQSAIMTVEIREQRIRQAVTPRRVRVYRPAGERAVLKKRTVSTNTVALNSSAGPPANQQPAEENAGPVVTPSNPLIPQLPFLPGLPGTELTGGESVGHQILVNLGALPR